MEALLIPLVILVLVGTGVLLVFRAMSTGRKANRGPGSTLSGTAPSGAVPPESAARQPGGQPGREPAELARSAAAKLDQEQHRLLYALIAQGQAMAAIKLYLEATGEGLRASRDAVSALAAHPQPFQPPATPLDSEDGQDDDEPQRFPYRYRAIASKGDVTREVSSNMLNDEIYGRIRTLARSGDTEGAVRALTRHSDISTKQAREFIALLDD
ncbi:hypothetical protein [Arthrobacter oryzae]|uniref:Uncharacterized protein n=1 Tax=Arthrobacter oryzae TaxID=409290 RepID=A0A3N0C9W6_9MICC|nr:hypothetical protein [Arthrobacter oryzae]RNL59826.1 hypothetical protein D7003_02360 [Arthrobacter oryzae]